MNFEEAFKHCQDGTATQEEKDYIKAQLAEANSFIQSQPIDSAPVREADEKEVKKAKRKWLRFILIPICVIVCALVAVGAVLGGVFGFAGSSAKSNATYNKRECVNFARQTAYEYVQDILPQDYTTALPLLQNINAYRVDEVDKHFQYNGRHLEDSYYIYVVEIDNGICEFEIEVDSRNGQTRILDIDDIDKIWRYI